MRLVHTLFAMVLAVALPGCQTVLEATGMKSGDETSETGTSKSATAKSGSKPAEAAKPATASAPAAAPAAPAAPSAAEMAARATALETLKQATEREVAEGRMTWEMAAKRQHRFAVENGLARSKADEDYWQELISIYRNLDNRYISADDAKAAAAEAEKKHSALTH